MDRAEATNARWTFRPPILEPQAATEAVRQGARFVVLACGSGQSQYEVHVDPEALVRAQSDVITPADNDRMLAKQERNDRRGKGKSLPTVMLAEAWTDATGSRLIVYREGRPNEGGDRLPDLAAVGLA